MSDASPPVTSWRALSVEDARTLLAPLDAPWWIAGGLAIDLFVGKQTRQHGDIDVAMLRGDCERIAALLTEWAIRIAHDGQLLPWDGRALVEEHHQLWMRRRAADAWELEILFDEHDGDQWLYRRDHRITRGIDDIGVTTPGGMRYIRPEIALLYKSSAPETERNAHDFAAAAPLLDATARDWLRTAIATTDAGHLWLASLSD